MSTLGRLERVCDKLGEFSKFCVWCWGSQLHFRRRVAILFRVAAAYVMGGAMFDGFPTLSCGALFGGCTGGDGCNKIVSTLGSDAGSFFSD